MEALQTWIPDATTIYQDLAVVPKGSWLKVNFSGMEMQHYKDPTWYFNVMEQVRTTATHWEVPLMAVAMYFIMIATLKFHVATYGKWNVRDVAFYWNAFLSIFSWCGVVVCVPVLLATLKENGLYFTCCAPAQWYGTGLCGIFVAGFIYSKVAELFDTVLLILAGKPVITLQWWHHSTVLLYCWHSYTAHIATGLWFSAMNYVVHSVMYGYFALMATKYRKLVSPFALLITLSQLMQMAVGMFVTIKAVFYQMEGQECHVNKTNSIFGLSMYFSYFVLFFIILVEKYCVKQQPKNGNVKKLN